MVAGSESQKGSDGGSTPWSVHKRDDRTQINLCGVQTSGGA